ncbi:MAG: protein kinase [Acetobacteraceae bacterium]
MATIEKLGKYEIRRTQGRGAAAIVYEGWDPAIQRRVAIKAVRIGDADDPETEELIGRFRREAQAAGRLVHPNIVTVYDYGETEDLAYIVMEFVEGPTVRALLERHERFSMPEIARIMEDVLATLQFSHERGVVHRDVKPANVMLTSHDGATRRAKLADFGIARLESSNLTQAGTIVGTPAYMSPEQFLGDPVDARSDVYSAGVLLYQLLTGERPFDGTISAIIHKVLNTQAPAPSRLAMSAPMSLDAVVRKAIAKKPEDRYPSAASFAHAIQDALSGSGVIPDMTEVTVVEPPPHRTSHVAAIGPAVEAERRRTRWPLFAALAAGVVLLALAGGTTWWVMEGTHAPRPLLQAGVKMPGPAQVTPWTGAAPAITPPASAPAVAPVPAGTTGSAAGPGAAPGDGAAAMAPTTPALPEAETPAAPSSAPVIAAMPVVPPQPAADTAPPPVVPPASGLAPADTSLAAPAPAGTAPPMPLASPTPGPVRLPTSTPAQARSDVGALVAGLSCALVSGHVNEAAEIVLTGVAGPGVEDAFRSAQAGLGVTAPVAWQVTRVDPVFCPTLDAVRPARTGFALDGPRLTLTLAEDRTVLRDGDSIRPRLIMPPAGGHLRVDYVTHDGAVQHLFPQASDTAARITADADRAFAPAEWVSLGDPQPNRRGWEASEPYGTDLIIALTSTRPLFIPPLARNTGTAADYARALRLAVQAVLRDGGEVAAAAIAVEVVPR